MRQLFCEMDGTWQWLLTFVPKDIPPGAPPRPGVDPNLFMPAPTPFAMSGNSPFVQSQYERWVAAGMGAAFPEKGFGKGALDVLHGRHMDHVSDHMSEVGAGNPSLGEGKKNEHAAAAAGIEEMFGKGWGNGKRIGEGVGNDPNAEKFCKGAGKGFGKDAGKIGNDHAKDSVVDTVLLSEDEDLASVAKNGKKRQNDDAIPPMQPTVKAKSRPLTPTPPKTKPPLPKPVEPEPEEEEEVLVEEPVPPPSNGPQLVPPPRKQEGYYHASRESKHESYHKEAWGHGHGHEQEWWHHPWEHPWHRH